MIWNGHPHLYLLEMSCILDNVEDALRDPSQQANGWLVVDAKVLASVEIAVSKKAKAKGLLGRTSLEGAYYIENAKALHSFGMKFDLDVAFVNSDMVVVKQCRLPRNRCTSIVFGAKGAFEAEAGAFGKWGLAVGDKIELRR